VAPELVASIFELVGSANVALVTDAMAAAGIPDGAYRLGSLDVTVSGGVARLSEGGAIAGGTAHLLDVVRTTVAGGVPLVDAVRAASATPATVFGDSRVGALRARCLADVVLTDADLRRGPGPASGQRRGPLGSPLASPGPGIGPQTHPQHGACLC
jgi:N-acetylglucosamine-6-phosphate deacetylase